MKPAFFLLLVLLALPPVIAADGEPASRGKQVFNYWCQPCHGQGTDKPGTVALQAKYKGQVPAELEKRRDLTPAITKRFVRTGISVMPFFRQTEISNADLEALAAYLAGPGS